jgi:hypothetical protein
MNEPLVNNSKQSRKFLITWNDGKKNKLPPRESILETIRNLKPSYFCLSEEIATTGTHHYHIYLERSSAWRYKTILANFPGAHVDIASGTTGENRDYVSKSGKWENTAKAETSVPGSFYEEGDPLTCSKSSTMQQLIECIQSGQSTTEIILANPKLAFRGEAIDELRERLVSDQSRYQMRTLNVQYLFGATGSGKTRSIYSKYSASEICRISNYPASGIRFDAYTGQKVLVFEEFAGQVKIRDMLNYLDIYPITLPARYRDRVACFTEVYLTSNLPPNDLYPYIQEHQPETWRTFWRRIDKIVEFLPDTSTIEHQKSEYIY